MSTRFVVIGTSGAGKSTFAYALAKAMACPYIELDWTEMTRPSQAEEFLESVSAARGRHG